MYLFTQLSFALLTVLSYGWLVFELQKGLRLTNFTDQRKKNILRGTIIALTGWLVITGILSYSGFLSDFSKFPPRLGIVLIIPLIVIIWITRTQTVREILRHVPQQNIVRIQSFRIFVESCYGCCLLKIFFPFRCHLKVAILMCFLD